MTRTIFKNVPRKQLVEIIHKAIEALANNNCETFEFSLDTDGDESSIEIIKKFKEDNND